jgi:tetratricopeptide (TPR) repeat protein
MFLSPAHRLKLYRNLKALDAQDAYSVVRFYEENEEAFAALYPEEYLDCALVYTRALFQTNDYTRHIVMCDHLIEFVMTENLDYWGGEDQFTTLLWNKSQSLFYLEEFAKAVKVLHDLVRINPHRTEARDLLLLCLLRQKPPYRQKVRAIALLLLLLAAVSAGLSGLVFQAWFPDWQASIGWVSVGLLGTGMTLLLGVEVWHYVRSLMRI